MKQQLTLLSKNTVLWIRIFSFFATCVGVVVLCGWWLDIETIKSVLPGLASMKFNAALVVLLLGITLFLQSMYPSPKIALLARRAALFGILAISVLTLSEYVFAINIGIDQLFFSYDTKEIFSPIQGRMSLLTTICFLLQGVALLLIEFSCAWSVVQFLAIISIVIAMFPLGGYLFGDVNFLRINSTPQMAIHTALVLLLLGIGILGITSVTGAFAELKKRLPSLTIIVVLILLLLVSMARIYGLHSNKKLVISLEKHYEIQLVLDSSVANMLEFSNQAMFFELDSYDKDFHRKNLTLVREKLRTGVDKLKELTVGQAEQQQQQHLDLFIALLNNHFSAVDRLIQDTAWSKNNEFDELNRKLIQVLKEMGDISRAQISAEQDELLLSKDTASIAVIFSMLLSAVLILWVFNALRLENVHSKKLAAALDIERQNLEVRVKQRTKDLLKKNLEIQELNNSLEHKVEERTRQLQEINDEYCVLNETLAERIEKEVKNSREKDGILVQQSRLAAMGEMIGNIAHQWRQPLNALSLAIANIQDAYEYNELTEESLNQQVTLSNKLIQTMSSTIDDFRDFFKVDNAQEVFDVGSAIQDALGIVQATFKNKSINVDVIAPHSVSMRGFKGQYRQVLLNILGNAKDALLERNVTHGNIIITLEQKDNFVVVRIRDNAGGIKDEIIEKIFDPYFTTRAQGNGIGLYMSKMIIENNMHGLLRVKNVENGAEFEIKVNAI